MKKTVRKTESGYPLMRYLSLLLVVALLFSGVTFARYALERRGSIDTGVALFDASYTVEGVNSLTFGNQSYWMNYSGQWYEQGEGSARTVRIGMQNKSDVNVRANVLHMEGPAEFWENIALQLVATADNSVAAGDPLTPQIVLADLLREVTGAYDANNQWVGIQNFEDDKEYHQYTYANAYIHWTNKSTENEATEGEFSTSFSDEFGAVEGIGDADLTMRGGIDATFDADGNVISVSESSVTASWETAEEDTWSMTITASMKMVQYSVGFARKQDQQTLPVFYLDCEKSVPYYSIDITLPDTEYFNMAAGNGTTSVLAFLTWTNSSGSDDLSTPVYQGEWSTIAPAGDSQGGTQDGTQDGTQGGTFNEAQVTGYHFNYTDVPAQRNKEAITTTVRMNYSYANGGITSWEHVASISSGDGVYAHDIVDSNGNIVILGTVPADSEEKMVVIANDSTYQCSGENPVTIAASDLEQCSSSYNPSEFEMVQGGSFSYATEKGYEVRFSVSFVQASEQP